MLVEQTLPLFTTDQFSPNVNQSQVVSEEKIITPLTEVLSEINVIPNPNSEVQKTSPILKKSLDELFPEQQYEEKNIKLAKETLGELAEELSPEQLRDAITEAQYLAESFLNDFERRLFNGLTLNELLHEKGGL